MDETKLKFVNRNIMKLTSAFLAMLIFVSATSASSTEPWMEYKLKYAGTVLLPPGWNESFPPSNFKPDDSGVWIELRASASNASKSSGNMESEITVLWFNKRGVRVPQYFEDWRQITRIVSEGQYRTLLRNGTLSSISEIPFELGRKRGIIATHEIRNTVTDTPLIRVKYVLVYYDEKIFLLRVNYFPESEDEVKGIAEEILSQWKMPPLSILSALTWLLIGFTALLAVLVWRRKSKEKQNGGGEGFTWPERSI